MINYPLIHSSRLFVDMSLIRSVFLPPAEYQGKSVLCQQGKREKECLANCFLDLWTLQLFIYLHIDILVVLLVSCSWCLAKLIFTLYYQHCSILFAKFNMSTWNFYHCLLIRSLYRGALYKRSQNMLIPIKTPTTYEANQSENIASENESRFVFTLTTVYSSLVFYNFLSINVRFASK